MHSYLIIELFPVGAVVHKLMRHKTTIVSVSLTIDSNMAITGRIDFIELRFLAITILFSASQDGLLSAWSTMTGIHLAAFHFNHTLVKLLVSQSGGKR